MNNTTETARQYAERDIMALDKIGGHYSRHVAAMTAEGLHAKSDIAAELAYRDAEIARLRDEHAKLLRFARLNLSEWPETESFEIQEAAKVAGLAVGIEYAKPCGDDCACASFYGQDEFPMTCYRLADFVRAP